ncbi:MAG: hypothetical protein H6821_06635 [Planctomycetaceae bacterium]|nr:hypothetical protein [Planctomycetaceae bacterium]MCB9941448.1 hypothetical protein [Planctomycetaceae bacterium]
MGVFALDSSEPHLGFSLHDTWHFPGEPGRESLQGGRTVLAAGSTDTRAIARGHDAFLELLHMVHETRVKQLEHAGFTIEQANTLSDLHTPNFM